MRKKITSAMVSVALALGVAAPIVAGPAAGSASAYGIDRILDWQMTDGNGKFGQARRVSEVDSLPGFVGHWACAGAFDIATGTWAGTTACNLGDVSHPYNGVNWRNGWGGVPYGVSDILTTDQWWN